MTYKLRVIIESPYAGASKYLIEENIRYARLCVRHSILRGEAPIAFHLLYTQQGILRDHVKEERKLGMDTSRVWYESADICAVYKDMGISLGMQAGIDHAKKIGLKIDMRTLGATFNV